MLLLSSICTLLISAFCQRVGGKPGTSASVDSRTSHYQSFGVQQAIRVSNKRGHTPKVMAYFTDWTSDVYQPEMIDWSQLSHIHYAFALPQADGMLQFSGWNSNETLKRLVGLAHRNAGSVSISVGGWTGSRYFSDLMQRQDSRQTLINELQTLVSDYNLDGIDIDWEYPNASGNVGNTRSEDDTSNFLMFLRLLRQTMPTISISAAVQIYPFADSQGLPLKDVSAFADVLDFITIMSYDIWPSGPHPGPNAPLSDGCGNSTMPYAQAESAIQSWADAGFSIGKIVLGIAGYGQISTSTDTELRQRDNGMVVSDSGSDSSGQVTLAQLVTDGALYRASSDSFLGSTGWTRRWDQCSSTPFLTRTSPDRLISYDDPESVRLKAQLVLEKGAAGVCLWSLTGDTPERDLVGALRRGLALDN